MEIVVGGGEKLYSQNLRDFLRIKEEDHNWSLNASTSSSSGEGRRSSTGLTLSAVLSEKGGPPPVDEPPLQRIQSNRTLLDIIREDQTPGLGRGHGDGRRSWRHLKDKIRLRRRGSGNAWSSAIPVPLSDVPRHDNNNNHRLTTTSRQPSIRFDSISDSGESTQPDVTGPSSHRNPSLPTRQSIRENIPQENEEEEVELSGHTAEAVAEGSPEQPVRTSLMALLAENDRQMGFESAAYMMDEDEECVEEDTGGDSASAAATAKGIEYNSCCVCMVRHKGAAFIPCGHTFCRLCSRELWVQRGNCPLCNNHILEILDIF